MKITIKNKFHNTEIRCIVKDTFSTLSNNQFNRAKKELCGNGKECLCFGTHMLKIFDSENNQLEWTWGENYTYETGNKTTIVLDGRLDLYNFMHVS